MNASDQMTRGEVAERAGVGTETLRYYERRGLIPEPPRSSGGYRLYDETYVRRLHFIGRAQELGFTLEEIKELLELRVEPEVDCREVRALADERLADVEEKIRDLQRIRQVLDRLTRACRSSDATAACPILDALQLDESQDATNQ